MKGFQTTSQRKIGLSERAERTFKRLSSGFLMVLGAGWAYALISVAPAADKVNLVRNALAESVRPESLAVTSLLDPAEPVTSRATLPGEALGLSGKLRAVIKDGVTPGIVQAAVTVGNTLRPITDFNLITPRPAADKKRGKIGLYYLGNWPKTSSAKGGQVRYEAPTHFIEVTRSNADTKLSEHFRVRDFLTHDQQAVWPKYLSIDLRLVDKLELVMSDLQAHGINTSGVRVMSGFRTPQYNANGGNTAGRASLSRHMYGDAADIYIDSRGTGAMDDLNGDGKVNINDARVILAAVDRVERAHPSLVGGAGVYAGTSAHGPFIHIDARGYAARWVGTGD